jgi:hypothetical protein
MAVARFSSVLSVVVGLVLVVREVPDRGVAPMVVAPVHAFRGADSDVGEAGPGPARSGQLRFAEAGLWLHERGVQAWPTVPASRRWAVNTKEVY